MQTSVHSLTTGNHRLICIILKMITSRIRLLPTSPDDLDEETQEDILSSSLAVIFPDDITNQHGDAQNSVIYTSPSFGDVILTLADPASESRALFSHFVWNAGVELGIMMEDGGGRTVESSEAINGDAMGGIAGEMNWSVKGEKVLELGAGTGLAGIMAAYVGAEEVVISDYPAEEVLANIQNNVSTNVDARRKGSAIPSSTTSKLSKQPELEVGPVSVEGHSWGVLTDPFSVSHSHTFTRLLVADCLWMPHQHLNLLQSISHFLSPSPTARAWVIAGFHTGRERMRGFFGEDLLSSDGVGLEIERIWERNAEGGEREWLWERDGGKEDITGRKRWLVIAVLKRKTVA